MSTARLLQTTVLVLNRNWQAIRMCTVKEAILAMCADAATGMDISESNFNPLKWENWINLPVRERDEVINTSCRQIRMPTVIIACNYAKVPLKRPKFSRQGIWQRDGGICQYTGQKLSKEEGNIDHIHPVSKGGKTSWENCVLAHKKVNTKKGDKHHAQVGLKLRKKPTAPVAVPATFTIRNVHNIEDWKHFLVS